MPVFYCEENRRLCQRRTSVRFHYKTQAKRAANQKVKYPIKANDRSLFTGGGAKNARKLALSLHCANPPVSDLAGLSKAPGLAERP